MFQTTLAPASIVGTDLLFGMTLSFVGSGIHVLFGHVDQALVFKMRWKGLAPLLGQ